MLAIIFRKKMSILFIWFRNVNLSSKNVIFAMKFISNSNNNKRKGEFIKKKQSSMKLMYKSYRNPNVGFEIAYLKTTFIGAMCMKCIFHILIYVYVYIKLWKTYVIGRERVTRNLCCLHLHKKKIWYRYNRRETKRNKMKWKIKRVTK